MPDLAHPVSPQEGCRLSRAALRAGPVTRVYNAFTDISYDDLSRLGYYNA